MTRLGRFGPGVLGDEEFRREQALIEELGSPEGARFGPAVLGSEKAERVQELVEAASQSYLTIGELSDALDADPERIDEFLEAELVRPGGPRKGALKAFRESEEIRVGGPREDVLQRIEEAL